MIDLPSIRGIYPRKFGLVSWSNHVPFAFDLMSELRPRLFVELGTHSGESYFAFCQAAQESGTGTTCYAIDTWQGDEQAGFYDNSVYEAVAAHNAEFYPAFSYLLRGTFDQMHGQFADGTIDLLHIDGLHTYEAVRHDFEHWLPKVSDGGIILFHDVCVRHGDFGAWRLWDEISQNGYGVAFHQGYGLGVYRKNPQHPLPDSQLLRKLFSGNEGSVDNLRHYYAQAAEILRLRKANAELTDRVQRMAEEAKALEAAQPAEHTELGLRVYFGNSEGVFAEAASFHATFVSGDWVTIVVPLPWDFGSGVVRLDPMSVTGIVDLLEVRITAGSPGPTVWEAHRAGTDGGADRRRDGWRDAASSLPANCQLRR